jgi:hypothetical protein
MTVLDIDLDFFAAPTLHEVEEHAARPEDSAFTVWTPDAVTAFLARLGLIAPLPGGASDRHVDALWTWNAAAYAGRLELPFGVVHVDAHEDLGFGGDAWRRLQETVLVKPLAERRFEDVAPLADSGNYLLCAVALGWVREITFVLPGPLPPVPEARLHDLNVHALHLRDGDPASGTLQLKSRAPLTADAQAARCQDRSWTVLDPPVPIRVLSPDEVTPARYDLLTLARSPAFCPPKTDALLPLLERWLAEEAAGRRQY